MAHQRNSRPSPSGTPAAAATANHNPTDKSLLVSRFILETVESKPKSSRTSSTDSCRRNKGFHFGNSFVGVTYDDNVDGVGIRRGDKLVGVTTLGSEKKRRSSDQQKEKLDIGAYEELDSLLEKPSETCLVNIKWV